MPRLTPAQQAYILQFQHPQKVLARMPGLKESHLAGMFGLKLSEYRRIRRHFEDEARKAAAALLRDQGFARLLARLPFTQGQTVVALGDSISDDLQSWVEVLRHLLKQARPELRVKVVNAGISGHTTTEMISRFLDVVLLRPDWFICLAGTNDARLHGKRPAKVLVSAGETAKNLAMLRRFARTQTSARWVWMTPPPVIEKKIASHWFLGSLQLMWRNRDLAAVAKAVRCQAGVVVDLWKAFGDPPDPALLLPDGLHPSLAGQKVIVTALVKYLAFVHDSRPDTYLGRTSAAGP